MTLAATARIALLTAAALCQNAGLMAQGITDKDVTNKANLPPSVDIVILGTTLTKSAQLFTDGGEIKAGVVKWNTRSVTPKAGETFCILTLKITNTGKEKVSVKHNDMQLIVDDMRVTFVGGMPIDSKMTFGFDGSVLNAGQTETENIIVTVTEKGPHAASLQYLNLAPMRVDCAVKAGDKPAKRKK